jgi:hypothetical protein
VADADESARKDMEDESADELQSIEGEFFPLVPVCVVPEVEGDLAVLELDEAVIGDCDSVGVTAKIAKNKVWAAEGWSGVYQPLALVEGIKELLPAGPLCEFREAGREADLAFFVRLLQGGKKPFGEEAGEYVDGEEEFR